MPSGRTAVWSGQSRSGGPPGGVGVGGGDQTAQAGPSGAVLCEEDDADWGFFDVRSAADRAAAAGGGSLWGVRGDGQVDAEDRADSGLGGGLGEADQPEGVVPVGEHKTAHAQVSGLADELGGMSGAVSE